MVPGIASWPICESEGFQFAGVVEADKLVPHVQTVDFDPVSAEPKIRSALEFCHRQTRPGGPRVFGAQWDDCRVVMCNSPAPMVLFGDIRLDLPLALKSLADCGHAGPTQNPSAAFQPEWQDNLDRHFWNFLSIVERTTASRTLILGFGPESYKLGIADGAIHEMGRFENASAIVRKFSSTARARRKITYFAGARRRKKTNPHPLEPLELALAFGCKTAANGVDDAPWRLTPTGWPVMAPENAAFGDYMRRLAMHRDSEAWMTDGLGTDTVSWFRMASGAANANLSRRDAQGLFEWRNLPVNVMASYL